MQTQITAPPSKEAMDPVPKQPRGADDELPTAPQDAVAGEAPALPSRTPALSAPTLSPEAPPTTDLPPSAPDTGSTADPETATDPESTMDPGSVIDPVPVADVLGPSDGAASASETAADSTRSRSRRSRGIPPLEEAEAFAEEPIGPEIITRSRRKKHSRDDSPTEIGDTPEAHTPHDHGVDAARVDEARVEQADVDEARVDEARVDEARVEQAPAPEMAPAAPQAAAPDDSARFIAFLDRIEALDHAVRLRQRSYDLLAISTDDRVLDVGCGTGKAVSEMSPEVAGVTGVDVSERMIGVARQRFASCDFRIAAAEGLPFEDNSITCYRAERVYQHLAYPSLALAEALRVLEPGGRLVLIDRDYEMWAVDASNEGLTRTLMRAQAQSMAQPWIGRRYRNLLLTTGFDDVNVTIETLVFTDPAEVGPELLALTETAVEMGAAKPWQTKEWLAEQERRGEEDRFYLALPIFIATARKPS